MKVSHIQVGFKDLPSTLDWFESKFDITLNWQGEKYANLNFEGIEVMFNKKE